MQNKLPKGFVPVMITPFNADQSIDFEGLARLTDMYIQAGAVGLFANCLSSEMYLLTHQERLQLVETIVKTANGRVPIVATGTLGGTIQEMADFSIELYATGIDAVIVINSVLVTEQESDTLFLERMHQFMALTNNIPLGIYECPVPYKRLISKQVLEDLLPTGRLIYHKDTSLCSDAVKERIQLAEGYNFGLYDAYMVNAVSSLKAGAMGLSCIQGNYFPELVVWLCQHYNNPAEADNVARVQQFFVDTMDVIHHTYPISAKYVLQQRGFDITLTTRWQVGVLTNETQRNLDDLLKTYKAVTDDMRLPLLLKEVNR